MSNPAMVRHFLESVKHQDPETRATQLQELLEVIVLVWEASPEELMATTLFDEIFDVCAMLGVTYTPEEDRE